MGARQSLPDISLLPAIAAFYDVTVDDLLGVGEQKKQLRIDGGVRRGKELLKEGKTSEAVKVWRELYAEFPNNHEIIAELAFTIYFDYMGRRDNPDCLREVISLEKRILEESTVQHLRDAAIERLCYSFAALGETEKAREYAEMAGSVNSSKEILTANILSGSDRTRSSQSLIIQLVAQLQNAVYHVESADWLARHETVIKLAELFFEDERTMGGYAGNAANAHYFCARIYAGMENAEDKVRMHLEKLGDCVKSYCGNLKYGGALFGDYGVEDSVVVKTGEETMGELYSRLLGSSESPMFDRFREEEWFKAVIRKIGENKPAV